VCIVVSDNKKCGHSGLVNATVCEVLRIQKYEGVSVLSLMNIEQLFFCILDLLNNAVNSSDYIVPNIRNTIK